MANIGVWIEIGEDGVKEANFGVLTAAAGSGANKVYALICSADAEACKDACQTYGAVRVVALSAQEGNLDDSPDLTAQALAAAVKEFELSVLTGLGSLKGRDLLARTAALLDVPLLQDCMDVDFAAGTVKKSHFSGKTVATFACAAPVWLCSIRPNAIEAAEAPTQAEVVSFEAPVADSGAVKVVEVRRDTSGVMELTEANIIITGGRPMDSAENFKILHECAEQLGAAVGASRAAVDAGFAPHSMQVGQTGKTVSPRLYVACGLSGSVQHFAGMKTSKVIVGINTDKDAPIFGKCNYGIVGDLFEVVPVLTEVLRERG
jgi:electron transfer flavoprotein alpha subunit